MRELRGDTIVLGLILSLLAFLYLFATIVTVHLQDDDGRVLYPAVIRLTHSAFAGMGLLIAFSAYRQERRRWWLMLVWAVVPVAQVILPIWWFTRGRQAASSSANS